MIYDMVAYESTDSSSISRMDVTLAGPNLELSELKLLRVPASKALLVAPFGVGGSSLFLARRSRAHLIPTPTRIMMLRADKHMAAMVPADPIPAEGKMDATRAWLPWSLVTPWTQ